MPPQDESLLQTSGESIYHHTALLDAALDHAPDGAPDGTRGGAGEDAVPARPDTPSGPAAGSPSPEGAREGAGSGPDGRNPQPRALPRRRGPADPVRGVMHLHHAMVAGAADVWEVAAGLEARGVTDVDARRLRHRDVFGLAEELFARVPRTHPRGAAAPEARPPLRPGARDLGLHLLPGLACILAAALHAPGPVAVGVLAVTAWPALRRGPLRTSAHAPRGVVAALCAVALLALARCGPDPVGTGTLAVLALTLLPAAGLARWFAGSARAQLTPSHGLADFADAVRPRLIAALAGYAATLLVLLAVLGSFRGSAVGALLFAARLLAVHGAPRTAAAGLAVAVAAQAALAALLPAGPAEAVACGGAALALAAHALHLVPRASAHRT